MTITTAIYADFTAAVAKEGVFNEVECGDYLHHAANFLCQVTPKEAKIEREDRNFFGSSDVIVAATVLDDLAHEEQCAYIWELKAPQCYLFERDDNKNRFRPSQDFIKAENQLLHYYYEAIANDRFRQRYNVIDSRNIKLGGVIIGRSTAVAKNVQKIDQHSLEIALKVRTEYLYKAYNIRILTWDRVLAFLRP